MNDVGVAGRSLRCLPPSLKALTLIQAITSVGFGLYIPTSALYFTQAVGLPATRVGMGLAAAGLASLPAGVPLGHLADRLGARTVTMSLMVLQATLLVLATQVHSMTGFLCVIVGLAIVESGVSVAAGATFAAVVDSADRVWISAINRSVFNIGYSAGLLAAGLAVGVGTRWAYLALILGNAVATLTASLLYLLVPGVPGKPGAAGGRAGCHALRDLPYLLVGQVSGLVSLSESILVLGLPVWLVIHTNAPRQMAIWMIGINTLIVVLFQVRAARLAGTIAGAARAQRWALVSLAAACIGIWLTPRDLGWGIIPGLLVVVILVTLGELWGESAKWALRYELAAQDAQGQYGGVFGLGLAIPVAAGPLLVTTLPGRVGAVGWLIVGAVFMAGLAVSGPAVSLAARTRPASETMAGDAVRNG